MTKEAILVSAMKHPIREYLAKGIPPCRALTVYFDGEYLDTVFYEDCPDTTAVGEIHMFSDPGTPNQFTMTFSLDWD